MNFREYLKNNIVYLDGGMGTLLQAQGLRPGEHPERWNLSHSDVITSIHKSYFDAGSNIVCTNTFGANILKFSEDELEEIIKAAVANANRARALSVQKGEKFIALDIGPSGKLLKPLGDLDFEDAVSVFAKTVKLGVKYGVDLIIIETMNDSYETKAALLAAKENSNLPVIVSNAYGEEGKLMTGATPAAMVALLEGMGVDALGANCSLGPKQLRPVAEELLTYASVPVILKPNAGLPRAVGGKAVYDVGCEEFATDVKALVNEGYELAQKILRENMDKMHLIAEFLVKYEIMDSDQFKAAMEGTPTVEELNDMTAEKRRKSEEENAKRAEELEAKRKAEEEEAAKAAAENAESEAPEDEQNDKDKRFW